MATTSSFAEQLAAVRREKSKAFRGIPTEPPVQVDGVISASLTPNAHDSTGPSLVWAERKERFLSKLWRSPAVDHGCTFEDDEARTMLSETNALRRSASLHDLAWSPRLASIAASVAAGMTRRSVPFSHDGADARFAQYPLGHGDTYGENLARSEGIRPLAATVVRGWIGSPGHKKNLLGPFTACGIGAATDCAGVTFVVQLLALLPVEAGRVVGEAQPSRMRLPTLSSANGSMLVMMALLALLAKQGGWFACLT
eukprot:TRINITY_DN67597_c0_g1_i1.p1 TRINITY_DN67597_c0_g1~~TRINITY_DN67597_c0_g1_i1.p1  ORF type:complete len:255 (-),score=27.15 TRINITY_DN67597_c0_g1_i1:15-779(-)